jgi:hypothetical protein
LDFEYLPPRIAALPRDDRGYPIPYIVMRDATGKPQFTANDMALVYLAIRDGLCHVCGQALEDVVWFVGGAGSALANGGIGAFADGPMHHECMRFAVTYCPHIAGRMVHALAPRIGETLRQQGFHAVDTTTIPGTPSVFVAVSVAHDRWWYDRNGAAGTFIVRLPYRKLEYWQHGAMLPLHEARKLAKRSAREVAQGLQR